MNQLQEQLLKLTDLAPLPLDISFMMGYLAYPLPQHLAIGLKPVLKQLLSHIQDQLISPINVLQILAVLKFKVLTKKIESCGRLVGEIEQYAGELICDNNYLNYRYFEQKIIKEKENEGLGVDCAICTVEIQPKDVCYLSCTHMYHRFCFENYSKEIIATKNFPLRCPTEECAVELLMEEVNEYLSRELREKYDEFVFQNYVEKHMDDTSWCPTPGCQAVFTFDDHLDNYKCPTCKKHYCLACKCQMHTGLTCKEYQKLADMDEPDRKFMMLVKGAKFKQCPNCKFWVEKNEGCDHMTCRCKYQFCYVCGGKYGACKCNGRGRGGSELDSIEELDRAVVEEELLQMRAPPPPPPPFMQILDLPLPPPPRRRSLSPILRQSPRSSPRVSPQRRDPFGEIEVDLLPGINPNLRPPSPLFKVYDNRDSEKKVGNKNSPIKIEIQQPRPLIEVKREMKPSQIEVKPPFEIKKEEQIKPERRKIELVSLPRRELDEKRELKQEQRKQIIDKKKYDIEEVEKKRVELLEKIKNRIKFSFGGRQKQEKK